MNSEARQTAGDPARTDWVSLTLLWFSGIGAAMQFAKFSISLDSLQQHYASEPAMPGLVLSIVGFVGLVFGVSAGVFANRIGYKTVLLGALLLGAALSFLHACLPPMPVMFISRLLEGFSHLGIVVAAPTMMVQLASRKHQSIAMAIWGTFFGVAFALTGWIGPKILLSSGLSYLFAYHGILMLFLAILLMNISLPVNSSSRKEHEIFSVYNILLENLAVYRTSRTVIPGVIFFFHTSMFIALMTFMPRLSSSTAASAFLPVALPIASICGTFLAGALAQYLLKPPIVALTGYLMVCGFIAMLAMFSSGPVVYAILATAALLGAGIIQGATFATIPFLNHQEKSLARANGAVAQLGNLGATIGPPLFGVVINAGGMAAMAVPVAVLCAAGAASCLLACHPDRTSEPVRNEDPAR